MAHFTSGWSSPGNSPDSAPGGIQPSELAQIRGACSSQPTAEFPFRCIRNWTGSLTSPGSLPSVMALFLGEIFSQFQRNSLQRKRWNIMQLKIVPLTVWKLLSFLYQNWHQDSFYFYTLNAVAKKKKIWAAYFVFYKAILWAWSRLPPKFVDSKGILSPAFQMRRLKLRRAASSR